MATSDIDISDLPAPETDISDLPPPIAPQAAEPKATWLGAAKGVGDVGLSLGAGSLKAVNHAINDLMPGKQGRAQFEQEINKDPILNYQPQTDEGKYLMGKIRSLMSPVSSALGTAHDYIKNSFGERTADVVGDIATLAPAGIRDVRDVRGMMAEKAAAVEQGHPLTDVAEGEQARLGAMKDEAEARGYDLPEGGTADRHARAAQNNTPLVTADARAELGLPKNAPMNTPAVLAAGRQKYGAPGYQAIENLKDPIPLDSDALAEARTANMNGTPNERLPFPKGDAISGAQAVDFSKKARYLANQLEKNSQNPFAAQDAQMYRDAAEAVEDSVAKHLQSTGRGELAENWDAARTYYAKSYSVEGALDGAGNVRAGDLKTQLFKKGRPLSGNLESVANLAAQYPEAFKTTRVTMPAAGPIKRAVAAGLPLAGAYVGGGLAGGLGAGAGEMVGASAGNKLLGR